MRIIIEIADREEKRIAGQELRSFFREVAKKNR